MVRDVTRLDAATAVPLPTTVQSEEIDFRLIRPSTIVLAQFAISRPLSLLFGHPSTSTSRRTDSRSLPAFDSGTALCTVHLRLPSFALSTLAPDPIPSLLGSHFSRCQSDDCLIALSIVIHRRHNVRSCIRQVPQQKATGIASEEPPESACPCYLTGVSHFSHEFNHPSAKLESRRYPVTGCGTVCGAICYPAAIGRIHVRPTPAWHGGSREVRTLLWRCLTSSHQPVADPTVASPPATAGPTNVQAAQPYEVNRTMSIEMADVSNLSLQTPTETRQGSVEEERMREKARSAQEQVSC